MDCLILALEKLFFSLCMRKEFMDRLAFMINLLLDNPRAIIHGEGLRQLFELAFKVFLKRASRLEEDSSEFDQLFDPVHNFLRQIISNLDRHCSQMMANVFRGKKSQGGKEVEDRSDKSVSANCSSDNNSMGSLSKTFSEQNTESDTMVSDEKSLRDYIQKTAVYLVDQAAIYHERAEAVKRGMKRQGESLELVIQKCVPIHTVPPLEGADPKLYSKAVKVNLLNEINVPAGTFGWCFICRDTAEFYCKDRRLPVCSKSCKEKLGSTLGTLGLTQARSTLRQPQPSSPRSARSTSLRCTAKTSSSCSSTSSR